MDGSRARGTRLAHSSSLALCGAVLFAANVAPTEEIVDDRDRAVGRSSSPCSGIATMVLAALILFFSDFRGARRWARVEGRLRGMVRGTVVTYAVGLVASAGILWMFGRFDGDGAGGDRGADGGLSRVASTIGASAGRLLLQGGDNGA